ncbi:MAG: Metallophosphoesterase [Candidatus Moranbacteria bacterium GW2011_GWF2_34_56]|nr:MAG: Metallophosphoesterase [Candidatus Moranbacteria bacterium GW2011_GWF1_34_10]KKP65276.1 MAG: Metallophosphoesterase [Candidatus Moranbacteria bacterium GW2011_GWF2_34_56]HBI16879.1 hypothetical protein [Candidatus Moranbacteria bacterium]
MKKLFTIAAISDLHLEKYSINDSYFNGIEERADALLIGGDMNNGKKEETEHFLKIISEIKIPILMVFGNHECDNRSLAEIKKQILVENNMIKILDGSYQKFDFNGKTLIVSGTKGYGGGFSPYNIINKGEKTVKEFFKEEIREVDKLKKVFEKINKLKFDFHVVLTHWAPFEETIKGEPKELYMVLGSSRMGDVIESQKPDLALSGHSHRGSMGIKKARRKQVSTCNISYDVNNRKICFFEFYPGKIKLRY